MTAANFQRALRGFSQRAPFRPYLVELVSGDRFRVTHPEALSLRGSTALYLGPNRAYRVFDSEGVCQLFDPPAVSLDLG
jgi:hypothetical protein